MLPNDKEAITAVSAASVCAIIVTYRPDLSALERLISAVSNQVSATVIIDNGSPEDCVDWIKSHQQENIIFLPLVKNVGVAEAHNHAIRWAHDKGFTHVILFDQDSLPSSGMIEQLLTGESQLLRRGELVAAVGPQCRDPRFPRAASFARFSGLKLVRIYCENEKSGFCEADSLISSGMLIRMAVLDTVGLMDAALFIDYVDTEWCFRAKQMGYRCFGVCAAEMNHTIGDRIIPWRNGKRIIPVHSPLRNYYLIRNAILLYKRSYIPLIWIGRDTWRLLLRYGFFSLLISPRFLNFRMMTIGLWHGIIGVSGEFSGDWQPRKSEI
jgi:rhamnosyltransferase